jgi:glycosyltransferase involved in cell wall biosynthesis
MITELVIATFQKPRYLATVLQSLLKQHCLPSEICIADDGSDRDTENVIQNFQYANPSLKIRHIWHKNLGVSKKPYP